jgi:hypothetical protein
MANRVTCWAIVVRVDGADVARLGFYAKKTKGQLIMAVHAHQDYIASLMTEAELNADYKGGKSAIVFHGGRVVVTWGDTERDVRSALDRSAAASAVDGKAKGSKVEQLKMFAESAVVQLQLV